MNPTRRAIKAAAIATVLFSTLSPIAAGAAEDKDVIAYRQGIMKALDAQTAALGMMLSGAIPPDNLVSHLETIALIAASSLESFRPNVPGGESNPEVWAKWADFETRMNDFSTNIAKVAKLGKEQGQDAIMNDLAPALSCKSCHDHYRKKQ